MRRKESDIAREASYVHHCKGNCRQAKKTLPSTASVCSTEICRMASLRSSGGHSVSPTTHNAEDWKLTILVSIQYPKLALARAKFLGRCRALHLQAVKNQTNRGSRSRPNLASKIKEEDEARAEAAPEVAAKGCVWNRTRESQNMQKPGEAEIKHRKINLTIHYSQV